MTRKSCACSRPLAERSRLYELLSREYNCRRCPSQNKEENSRRVAFKHRKNKMTKFVNFTPHVVTEVLSGRVFPSHGAARVSSVSTELTHPLTGAPTGLFVTSFGEAVDLPAPSKDVMIIVSAMVRQALPERRDLVSPGDLVRDENGQPIGCRGFTTNLTQETFWQEATNLRSPLSAKGVF